MSTGGDDVPLPPRAGPVIDAGADVGGTVWDPAAHLRSMDDEGIDQVVLFPTTPPAANDVMAACCAAAPRRLFGTAALAGHDPIAAARELRRSVTELGLVAGLVGSDPSVRRHMGDRAHDVLWETAAALAVPIGIRADPQGMRACSDLILSGALERHPGLRLVLLGTRGEGAAAWLHRVGTQAALPGDAGQEGRHAPQDVAGQCAISLAVDETMPSALTALGQTRALWGSGSDRPRDAPPTGIGAAVRDAVALRTTAEQVHVLGLNARRLYGLPSRRTGLSGLLDDYFTAVTAQDIDLVRALFAPDAVFESGAVRLQGRDSICGYYLSKTFTFEDFRPVPQEPSLDGTTIHVDIDVHIGGRVSSVHDVFETDGASITRLRVSGFEEALGAARS